MALNDIRSIALPYCLQLQSCGRYVLLNREYKPLGFTIQDWVQYQHYSVLLNVRVTPTLAAKLSYRGERDNTVVWLYGDDCIPTNSQKNWQNYAARLAALSKLKHLNSEWCSFSEIALMCRANLRDAARFQGEQPKVSQKNTIQPITRNQLCNPDA